MSGIRCYCGQCAVKFATHIRKDEMGRFPVCEECGDHLEYELILKKSKGRVFQKERGSALEAVFA